MKPTLIIILCLVTVLSVEAGWQNGQNADLVLGQADFTTGNPGNSATEFMEPRGIAIDPTTGNVFVSDTNNSRVVRFASLSALTNGAAAIGVLGQADLDSAAFVNPPTAASMLAPGKIAFDQNGTLWVADTANNRVLRFDNASAKADADGADADGVLGQGAFDEKVTGTSNTAMSGPLDVAVDSNGTLWVADTGNHRVLRFAAAAGKSDGAPANGVLGQAGFVAPVTFPITASNMDVPSGVAVDGAGRLWVVDLDRHRVLRFDAAALKANGAAADGVLGQSLFTTTSPGSDQDSFRLPNDVEVAPNGDLWVADGFDNNRVLRFANAAAKADGAAADTVLGQPDFDTVASDLAINRFNGPRGIHAAGSTTVLISDSDNHRVLRFRDPVILQIAALKIKIKKLKREIKRAKKKSLKRKARQLKKKLKRFQKRLRALQ